MRRIETRGAKSSPARMLELSDRVRRGELDAFVVIPPDGDRDCRARRTPAAGTRISLGQSQRRLAAQMADRRRQRRSAIAAISCRRASTKSIADRIEPAGRASIISGF